MNSLKSTSQHKEEGSVCRHQGAGAKKLLLMTGFMAIMFFAFSPAWAGDYSRSKVSPASVHLTGLSIQIGPGGFHIGIGGASYGRGYGGRHFYRGHGPHRHWKHSRHQHRRHNHYASPKRFGHRHGWKNDRPRGDFRGKSGRGNGGHRGGRW